MTKSRGRGQSLIEVVLGIAVLIPILLTLLDFSCLFLALQSNESICRSAVRAAAAGDPHDARVRASAVVDSANKKSRSPLVSNFSLIEPCLVNITSEPAAREDPLTGNMTNLGGPVKGTVTITTNVDVRPFVIGLFWGGKLPLKLQARHVFPISFIQPRS